MPIEIIDLDGGLGNRIVGTGIITAEEYIDSLTQHLSEPEVKLKKYLYSISDYTDVEKGDIDLSSAAKIARLSVKVSKINPSVIVVIIAPSQVFYGLAKIWSGLAKMTGWKIKVYKQRNEAMEWLMKTMKDLYPENALTYR